MDKSDKKLKAMADSMDLMADALLNAPEYDKEHHVKAALHEIEMIESGKMSFSEIDASLQLIKMHISYL